VWCARSPEPVRAGRCRLHRGPASPCRPGAVVRLQARTRSMLRTALCSQPPWPPDRLPGRD
jgi:hypothetical protein